MAAHVLNAMHARASPRAAATALSSSVPTRPTLLVGAAGRAVRRGTQLPLLGQAEVPRRAAVPARCVREGQELRQPPEKMAAQQPRQPPERPPRVSDPAAVNDLGFLAREQTLEQVQKVGQTLPITVTLLSGDKHSLELPMTATVTDIKRSITERTGAPPDVQRLVLKSTGKNLVDGQSLVAQGVQPRNEVIMVTRLRGG